MLSRRSFAVDSHSNFNHEQDHCFRNSIYSKAPASKGGALVHEDTFHLLQRKEIRRSNHWNYLSKALTLWEIGAKRERPQSRLNVAGKTQTHLVVPSEGDEFF